MSSQDITLFLYPLISSRRNLVSASFKQVYYFLYKSRCRNNLKSYQKNLRMELHKTGVNLNYTLSNRYNGPDLIFMFKKGLYLII